jgi:PAS domain S-box-containing protein
MRHTESDGPAAGDGAVEGTGDGANAGTKCGPRASGDRAAHANAGGSPDIDLDIDPSIDWMRLTLGSLVDGVITTDAKGTVTFINAAACALTGHSADDALGRPIDSVLDICGSVVTQRDGTVVQIDCTTTPLTRPAQAANTTSHGEPRRADQPLRAVLGAVHVLRAVDMSVSTISVLETRLSAVVDQLPVGVGLFDMQGRLQLGNALLARFMGRSFPPRDAAGLPRWRAWCADGSPLPPNDWPTARALRGDTVQPGIEFLARRDDGANTWLRAAAVPFRNALGEPIGALTVLEDIDEFKRAQLALQATSTQMELVTQHLPVRIAHIDAHLRYRFVNQPYAASVGRKAAELIGQRVAKVIGEAAYATIGPRMASALRGAPQDFDMEWPYASGETQFVRCAFAPEHDAAGAVVGLVASVVDISDRKTMEDAIRASDERLRSIMESALDYAIITTDLHCHVLSWSDGAQAIFGYTAAEMLGRDARILFSPEDRAGSRSDSDTQRAMADGRCEIDGLRVRKNGTRFWAGGLMMPLRDQYAQSRQQQRAGGGEAATDVERRTGFLVVLRDLTESRHDKQLLERQADELHIAARHKDEFVAMVAHELRNPLVPLRNAVHLMRKAGSDSVDRDKWCSMMERQLKQMTALIDDLLDVSQISRGQIALQTAPVHLTALLREAVQSNRLYVEAAGHLMTFAVPPVAAIDAIDGSDDDMVVEADAARLLQVVANLLTNAAKFTPRGGHVRLALHRAGNEAVITVEDNGIGIAADMLPKVFELYTQVDSAKSTAQGGLGLGLAIVRRLVELHGGSVAATSAGAGMGSRFTVRLPLGARPARLPVENATASGTATATTTATPAPTPDIAAASASASSTAPPATRP